MAEKAQIVNEGGTQVVRLPDSVRFPDDQKEVTVRREGDRLILEPDPESAVHESWSAEFLATCGAWKEEIERPPQTPITDVRNPFD